MPPGGGNGKNGPPGPDAAGALTPQGAGLASGSVSLLIDATVVVFETNDVVLAQIVTALHFDQHQINHTRVFQAVFVTCANEGRFIGMEHQLFLIVDDNSQYR